MRGGRCLAVVVALQSGVVAQLQRAVAVRTPEASPAHMRDDDEDEDEVEERK
jgi:hypothetical protein